MTLNRIPAPRLQGVQEQDLYSDMRKHPYAYETPDHRWLIQFAYGACRCTPQGWNVFDMTGTRQINGKTIQGALVTNRVKLADAKAYVAKHAAE